MLLDNRSLIDLTETHFETTRISPIGERKIVLRSIVLKRQIDDYYLVSPLQHVRMRYFCAERAFHSGKGNMFSRGGFGNPLGPFSFTC